jgi:hypothetical protein
MVTEKGWIFSNAQAITTSGATNGTNVVDTEFAASNLGGGTPLWLVVRVNTLFVEVTSGSETLDVQLQTSATSGGTYTKIASGFLFSGRECVKGLDLLTCPLPVDNLRYLKVVYTTTTGSGWSAGNVDAFLTLNAPRNT